MTAARAACGPPGSPRSFMVSAMSMKGMTNNVPGPPYSECRKVLKISVQIPTTSSTESLNKSFFESFFSRWPLNFSVSSSANSGMGSGNLYSAALQMWLARRGFDARRSKEGEFRVLHKLAERAYDELEENTFEGGGREE